MGGTYDNISLPGTCSPFGPLGARLHRRLPWLLVPIHFAMGGTTQWILCVQCVVGRAALASATIVAVVTLCSQSWLMLALSTAILLGGVGYVLLVRRPLSDITML